jgi:4-hydroxyproline epimerase
MSPSGVGGWGLGVGRSERRVRPQPPTQCVRVIDSHTGGEPTRVVIGDGPELGGGSVAERLERFRGEYDHFRSAVVNEPRGSNVLVGALLVEPVDRSCAAGVIFFNNVGYLGMCGHGTIGLVVTLAHMGRIEPGEHRIETPVGVVTTRLHASGEVSVRNVPSHRFAGDIRVPVEGHGTVTGDIAWGGNWFFLVEDHRQEIALWNVEALTEFTWRVRQALARHGLTGRGGREIDHIELSAPSEKPGVHSKNFVLCPGKAYDRSPCGTGTSAKLACLYADGQLQEDEAWRQESITGSVFEGTIQAVDGELIPTIKGSAFVTAEATLILDPADPCCWGIG